MLAYDFSRIDYELERSKLLGSGLWSNVYLAKASSNPIRQADGDTLTPPASPSRVSVSPPLTLYAVKTPARPDAKEVFHQEATVLTHLMREDLATQYIVPFLGLDGRNSSLVFEAVMGGSLEDLNGRLKQMTEVARHLELVSLFPSLAHDLVHGLAFLHAAGVVHADLKSANVLLDLAGSGHPPHPVLRARYIDFSASFRPAHADSTAHAGGSWTFLAPEQLQPGQGPTTPTPASDVWSLGITLLTVLVGDSPYRAVCGANAFVLREAIKSGDALSFARVDPKAHKRLAACQDFVDCCRLALQKQRDRRPTAAAWGKWLAHRGLGI